MTGFEPYFEHLVSHPHYGLLFPHRQSLAAFGVPNNYHVRKHYPRLLEGQHLLRLQGDDYIIRIFYTLEGIELLAVLIGSREALAFADALKRHIRGGPLCKALPSDLVLVSGPVLAQEEEDPDFSDPEFSPFLAVPAPTPGWGTHPEASGPRAEPPVPGSDLRETADVIFQAQRLAADFVAEGHRMGQRLPPPTPPHLQKSLDEGEPSLFQQWDEWLQAYPIAFPLLMLILSIPVIGLAYLADRILPSYPPPPPIEQSTPLY